MVQKIIKEKKKETQSKEKPQQQAAEKVIVLLAWEISIWVAADVSLSAVNSTG